jgi:hypothetical protein
MQKRLSKLYLSEAAREIFLSVPDLDRDAFTRTQCEQRVREEYGDFNTDDFSEVWIDARQKMKLNNPSL